MAYQQRPNDLLRAARRALPSPSGSGLCMSREELADAMVAYLAQHRPGLRCGVNSVYVGKLERGTHRWPFAHYREALRAVLGRATDAELGFFKTHGADRELAAPADAPSPLTPAPALPAVGSLAEGALSEVVTAAAVQVSVCAEPGTAVTVVCPAGRVAVVAGGVRVLIESSGPGPVVAVPAVADVPAVSGGARVYSLAARRAR